MPTFGSLFAGIGGIDLGLERAGWTCRWQVEWDAYCQRVLAKHWPDVPRYGDITTVDWSGVERVDLLAGGFPCQPFSLAGKRAGKSDDRWLWPAFAVAIRALRPRYVLVENVPGLLAGHGGMGTVLGDLAGLGYDTEWDCVPAAAVGAPHLRYRVWIVAYANGDGRRRGTSGPGTTASGRPQREAAGRGGVPDADRIEHQGGPSANGWPSAANLFADAFGDALREQPVTVGWGGGSALPRVDGSVGDVADTDGEWQPQPGWAVGEVGGWPGDSGSPLADADSTGPQGRPVQPERPGERVAGSSGVGDPDSASADPYAAGRGPRGATGEPGWWRTEPDVGRVAHGVPARVDRLRALGNAVVPQVVEVIGRQMLQDFVA